MKTKIKLPPLVIKLTTVCSAWIVGGAVDEKEPRDYDIYIPIKHWREACAIIPKDAKVNSLGGFKCISDGIEVDVWTGEMSDFLASNYFKKCCHPQSGVKIYRK